MKILTNRGGGYILKNYYEIMVNDYLLRFVKVGDEWVCTLPDWLMKDVANDRN